MSTQFYLILFCGISALVLAISIYLPWKKLAPVPCLLWLAACLPFMYFMNFNSKYVLLFYIISSFEALLMLMGGKKE